MSFVGQSRRGCSLSLCYKTTAFLFPVNVAIVFESIRTLHSFVLIFIRI